MRSGVPLQLKEAEVLPPGSASPWESSCFYSSCSCSYSPWWWWWVGWRLSLRNCSCGSKRKHCVFVFSLVLATRIEVTLWKKTMRSTVNSEILNSANTKPILRRPLRAHQVVCEYPSGYLSPESAGVNLSLVGGQIPKTRCSNCGAQIGHPNEVSEPTESKRYRIWISNIPRHRPTISAVSHD